MFLRKGHIFLLDLPYMWQIFRKQRIMEESVIVVIHDLFKYGGEILGLNIVRELINKKYKVSVVALRPGPLYEDFNSLTSINIVSKYKLRRFLKKRLSNNICKKVICNTIISGAYSHVFAEEGYQVVTLIHEMENSIKGQFGSKYKKICDRIVNYSIKVVFPSNYVKRSFEKCYGQEIPNCEIHDQGLYFTEKSFLSNIEFEKKLKKHCIPTDSIVILNVAVGSYRKGFDLFLDVTKTMWERNKKIYFIWIGAECEEIYKKYEKKYGVEKFSNLRLYGYVDNIKELNSLNQYAKLLFLSSREDPFPAVVLNSFAVGTPVIAFKECGGFQDIVIDGETGYLIEAFNIEAMAEMIEKVVLDELLMRHMSRKCEEEVKKHRFDEYCTYLMSLFNK